VQLSDPEWREARKIILTAILGTDMSHHFEQISKAQVRAALELGALEEAFAAL
jgi:hypothetical protein